jgi:hypothetical protein
LICAYCGVEARATDEHVLPQWMREELPEHTVVSPARGRHLFGGELVIRDVCGACNSGPLSQLDEFAKAYWTGRLDGAESLPQVDAHRMARWAAKVCYNTQRATASLGTAGAEPQMPRELGGWVLRGGECPQSVAVSLCRFPGEHRDTDEIGTFGSNGAPLPRRYLKMRRSVLFLAWDAPGQPGSAGVVATFDREHLPAVDLNSPTSPVHVPMISDADLPLRGVWNNPELLARMARRFGSERRGGYVLATSFRQYR